MIETDALGNARVDRILVPLDGSALAETPLALAEELAGLLDAELALLHVVERGAPTHVHGQPHLHRPHDATRYLDVVAEGLRRRGVRVVAHVHEPAIGDVAAGIAQHADELAVGLILLCTHGSGGLRDLLLGSIAQQTLRLTTRPVLVVRPEGPASGLDCGHWIVALDPVVHGPGALPLTTMLARKCGARLHLLTVVPTRTSLPPERGAPAIFAPSATADVLEMEAQDMRRYMDSLLETLRAEGVEASTEVRRGSATQETLDVMARQAVGLLVIATHGHAGVPGVLSGSFAAAVVPRVSSPVLLVPLRD